MKLNNYSLLLSNPVKVQMLLLIKEEVFTSPTTISEKLEIEKSSVTYHLKELVQSGLVNFVYQGKAKSCFLVMEGVEGMSLLFKEFFDKLLLNSERNQDETE